MQLLLSFRNAGGLKCLISPLQMTASSCEGTAQMETMHGLLLGSLQTSYMDGLFEHWDQP